MSSWNHGIIITPIVTSNQTKEKSFWETLEQTLSNKYSLYEIQIKYETGLAINEENVIDTNKQRYNERDALISILNDMKQRISIQTDISNNNHHWYEQEFIFMESQIRNYLQPHLLGLYGYDILRIYNARVYYYFKSKDILMDDDDNDDDDDSDELLEICYNYSKSFNTLDHDRIDLERNQCQSTQSDFMKDMIGSKWDIHHDQQMIKKLKFILNKERDKLEHSIQKLKNKMEEISPILLQIESNKCVSINDLESALNQLEEALRQKRVFQEIHNDENNCANNCGNDKMEVRMDSKSKEHGGMRMEPNGSFYKVTNDSMNRYKTSNDDMTKCNESSTLTTTSASSNHSDTLIQRACRKRRQIQNMRRTATLDEDISVQDLKYFI